MSFIPEIFDVIVLETLFLKFKALLEDAAVVVVVITAGGGGGA
jgi:hypothetical protein